jgi:hypothetical protein
VRGAQQLLRRRAEYDPRTVTTPAKQAPLIAHWASGRWTREALPPVATLANPFFVEANDLDPDLFGISCVRQIGCTAIGAQPQGAHSAPSVRTGNSVTAVVACRSIQEAPPGRDPGGVGL